MNRFKLAAMISRLISDEFYAVNPHHFLVTEWMDDPAFYVDRAREYGTLWGTVSARITGDLHWSDVISDDELAEVLSLSRLLGLDDDHLRCEIYDREAYWEAHRDCDAEDGCDCGGVFLAA